MKYKAAMFDFDGTVTNEGEYYPSQELADLLVDLAQKMPIAFCTGRQLESFVEHGLSELLDEINPDLRHQFLENLFLMAENGAVGYSFNPKTDKFDEFYRTPWPSEFVGREELRDQIATAVEGVGHVYENAHRVVIVIRTARKDPNNIKEINDLSDKIYDILIDLLTKMSPDFEKHLHVGNSGIGVVIVPADGDKDNGIRKFAEFLTEHKGFQFDENLRELVVVGDQPQVGGNDHYFLNGKYGTPYTVGNFDKESEYPLPVVAHNGMRLLNAMGTEYLVKNLLLAE